MTLTAIAPWTLHCAWCNFSILVNARGAHGADQGSGVEAANVMHDHVQAAHGETWPSYLRSHEPPRNSGEGTAVNGPMPLAGGDESLTPEPE